MLRAASSLKRGITWLVERVEARLAGKGGA